MNDAMELTFIDSNNERRCCDRFDGIVFSSDWVAVNDPLKYGKELVAAAVDRIMAKFDLLASEAKISACADNLRAKLAAAT